MNGFEYQRKRRNMYQTDLAEVIGVDRSTISKWETGDSHPNAQMLQKIAGFYGCTMEELMAKDVEPEAKEA